MIEYIGELTIGAALPGASAAMQAALPDLQNRLGAMASFAPSTTDFGQSLVDAQATLAAIQTAIGLGISLPDMDAQFALAAAEVAALESALAVALDLANALLVGGLHVYRYQGDADQLGGEFGTELSGGFPGGAPTDDTNALVLATTVPGTWTAISSIFQVTAP